MVKYLKNVDTFNQMILNFEEIKKIEILIFSRNYEN